MVGIDLVYLGTGIALTQGAGSRGGNDVGIDGRRLAGGQCGDVPVAHAGVAAAARPKSHLGPGTWSGGARHHR